MSKIQKETHVDQHYVPETYLKQFVSTGNQIFIYDKKAQKSFSNSVSSVGYKKYFYDIPEKYIKPTLDKVFYNKYFEKNYFVEIEKVYAQQLRCINEKAALWLENASETPVLDDEDRLLFATLIAIQYLRMPAIRYKYLDFDKKFNAERLEIIKAFTKHEHPDNAGFIDSIKIDYDEAYAPVLHADIFSDEQLLSNITGLLADNHWVFYIRKEADLYTSDNPVLIKPHLPGQRPYHEGFGMPGNEVIFPLGSSLLLTIWDKRHFADKGKEHNVFHSLDDKALRSYNSYQYFFATQQVYARSVGFELIAMLKHLNGDEEYFHKLPTIQVNGR